MPKQDMPGRRTWPWRTVGGLGTLVVLLSLITIAQSNFQEDAEANQVISGGAFGYAAPDGRRVLAPVDADLAREMKRFSKVVAAPGRVMNATFAAMRRASGDADGQTAFNDTPGAIFTVATPLPGRAGVLVATDQFLAQRQVVPVTPLPDRPNCAAAAVKALAEHAGRPVRWCKVVATVGHDGGRLSVARFATQGHTELVSVLYTGPGGPIYSDHPADTDPSGARQSDAADRFSPDTYRPLFAFRGKDGLEVAVRRSEANGETMDLYRQQGQTFQPFIAASWSREAD